MAPVFAEAFRNKKSAPVALGAQDGCPNEYGDDVQVN
jgi:hypothetical protein